MRFPFREDVPFEADDDGGMLFNVQKAKNGILTAEVRVWGQVTIEGKQYSYDRNIRIRLTKDQ